MEGTHVVGVGVWGVVQDHRLAGVPLQHVEVLDVVAHHASAMLLVQPMASGIEGRETTPG